MTGFTFADTQVAAVIGYPISQSLSPLLHTYWLHQAEMDASYSAHDVAPEALGDFVAAARDHGLKGWNVTIPHKEAILPYLDRLAPTARALGAVNTVKRTYDGSLIGFNTDGMGLMAHLNAAAPTWPQVRPALVLGAGGAARAALGALLATSCPFIMLANRTRSRAETVSKELGRGRVTVVDWDDLGLATAGAGLILNTTSLGMAGYPPLSLDLAQAAADTVVYDIVYKPLRTALIKAAARRGLRTVEGLGMLIHQGAAAFKLWFDEDADTGPTVFALAEEALKP